MRVLKQYSRLILKKNAKQTEPPNSTFRNVCDLIKKKAKHTIVENTIPVSTNGPPSWKAFPIKIQKK